MPSGVPRVVRATVADGRAVALLKASAIRSSAAGYYSASALEAWASSVNVEATERAIATTTAYVAVTDSGVVGYSNLIGEEIDQLYVRPDYEGRGVARLLCEHVEAAAVDRGIERLTATASLRSAPVFLSLGFEEDERIERIYEGVPFEVVLVSKHIGL
ncbi:MAG TPA: GNAT family N-acetyltransferase [Solirubrobacteraceae bacterium]